MSDNHTSRLTQVPSSQSIEHPSVQSKNPENPSRLGFVEVGNGATRYDWSIAFSRMCMHLPIKDRDVAIAAAMRLIEFPGRGSGQCTAKRTTIANELGISERHLNRGLKVLKDRGWIRVCRHGRDDSEITLLIPPEGADIHRFGSKKRDGQQDNMMSDQDGSSIGQKRPPNRTGNGLQSDIQSVPCNEQVEQIEQNAASPRASEYADRVGPVTKTNGASVSRARARGALNVPDDIDIEFDNRARAYLEKYPMTTVFASS